MKIFYFKADHGNFGDDLNQFLWDDLLPGLRDGTPDITLFGVGTILAQKFVPDGRILVVGSGTGYSAPPDIQVLAKWDIRAVRGPRTATALGLPLEKAFVDPAVMVPLLPRFSNVTKTDEVLFVPHYRTLPDLDWAAIAATAGVTYQSPSDDCETVIRRIAGARAVLAESMHAAIIADAFGVPWTSISIGENFNTFKWADWQESLGMTPKPAIPFFATFHRRAALQRTIRRRLPESLLTQLPSMRALNSYPVEQLTLKASRDLAYAARGPFLMTDRTRMDRQRRRFSDLLTQIRQDYKLAT